MLFSLYVRILLAKADIVKKKIIIIMPTEVPIPKGHYLKTSLLKEFTSKRGKMKT